MEESIYGQIRLCAKCWQNGAVKKTNRYYKRDLELMTGRQLREICRREKNHSWSCKFS